MDVHEPLAKKTFDAALKSGAWVGQLRTRLGVPGYETKGPEEAAKALLNLVEGITVTNSGCANKRQKEEI